MNATEKLTRNQQNRAAEIARLIARLPEHEQDKIYYMLKGSEIFNPRAEMPVMPVMTRAAAI